MIGRTGCHWKGGEKEGRRLRGRQGEREMKTEGWWWGGGGGGGGRREKGGGKREEEREEKKAEKGEKREGEIGDEEKKVRVRKEGGKEMRKGRRKEGQ